MKYRRDDGSTSWRFWLGSRNLTRSIAWEAGLAIASDASAGQHIEGIAAAGELLAQHAHLDGWEPSRTRRELERLRWCVPQGIELVELRLWDIGEDRPLPKEPDGVQRVIVVSPYLNGSVIRQLGSWGGTGAKRTLVSTLPELRKLSLQAKEPLAKFKGELAYFESPVEEEPERDAGTAGGEGMSGAEDPEEETRGLHAKLLYAEHGKSRTLWMGSANATERGFLGPNAELLSRFSVSADVTGGLEAFVGMAREATPELLETVEPSDAEQEQLDKLRRSLAATWNLRQENASGNTYLCGDFDPYSLHADLKIDVGRQGEPLQEWPRGASRVVLPSGGSATQTHFIVIRLKLGDKECRWIQVVRNEELLTEPRDRAVISQFLDPKTFLSWIRSLLDQSIAGEGGGDWDRKDANHPPLVHNTYNELWIPSLEQALKTWIRDPAQLQRVDKILTQYLASMAVRTDVGSEEYEALQGLQRAWPIIRQGLISGVRRTAKHV
jgi:hypothetical protein